MELRSVLIGGGLGSVLAWVFDPDQGARRRALLEDKLARAMHKTADAVDATSRDLVNRGRGVVSETKTFLARDDHPSDTVLAERVRAKLGHYTAHPRVIDVGVAEGRVHLTGMIVAREYGALLRAVRRVRGVRDVEDLLEVHDQADVPELQGGTERTGERLDLFQTTWAPATQLLVAVAAIGLVATVMRGRNVVRGAALATMGSSALLTAAINFGVRSLAEAGLEQVRAVAAGGSERSPQQEVM